MGISTDRINELVLRRLAYQLGRIEAIAGKIASLRAGAELSLTEQREIIGICIENITLYPKNLYVFYRFPIEGGGRSKERITRVR